MASGYPAGRGLRNGFGMSRMVNHEQAFNADDGRILGYPNAILNYNGHRTPTPMSFTPGITAGIPVGTAVPAHDLFNSHVANDERRRRSSSMSPRTIRASTYRTPYTLSFPPSNLQTFTPPSSNSFTNHTTEAQVAAEPNPQGFDRASLSTVTAATRTSTTSAYTETPMGTHSNHQRTIFALLSDICTEALRRKWHDESHRRSIRSLASHRQRSSRRGGRSRGRYSPYAPLSSVPNQNSHNSQRSQRAATTGMTSEEPLPFMELMRRVASTMWENATQSSPQRLAASGDIPHAPRPAPTDGQSETAAIDSMRTLYSLGNSIATATSPASGRAEHFNVDEIRDIIGVAAGFCRALGYGEGAERCEEVGRRPLAGGEEEGQRGGWEGGVL